jgi:predicted DNA-binding transcriptional regulator AlpA
MTHPQYAPEATSKAGPDRGATHSIRSWSLGRNRDLGVVKRDPSLKAKSVCTELKISRRSFDRWRALGTGPRVKHLAGNGSIRIRRSWLNEWLDTTDEDIA